MVLQLGADVLDGQSPWLLAGQSLAAGGAGAAYVAAEGLIPMQVV